MADLVEKIKITPDEQRRADSLITLAIRAAEREAEHRVNGWQFGRKAHVLSLFRLTSVQVNETMVSLDAIGTYEQRSDINIHHLVFQNEAGYLKAEKAFEKIFPAIPTGGFEVRLDPLF